MKVAIIISAHLSVFHVFFSAINKIRLINLSMIINIILKLFLKIENVNTQFIVIIWNEIDDVIIKFIFYKSNVFSFDLIDIVNNMRYNREIVATINKHKWKRQYNRMCDEIFHDMFDHALTQRFFFFNEFKMHKRWRFYSAM